MIFFFHPGTGGIESVQCSLLALFSSYRERYYYRVLERYVAEVEITRLVGSFQRLYGVQHSQRIRNSRASWSRFISTGAQSREWLLRTPLARWVVISKLHRSFSTSSRHQKISRCYTRIVFYVYMVFSFHKEDRQILCTAYL